MHESVKGELASHMAAAAVADAPARGLPDRGATGREPDPRGFYPGNTSIRRPQVAGQLAPDLRAMAGYKMPRAPGSCVGADQARRGKP